MWQPSSNFSSRIVCAMRFRHFYRLTADGKYASLRSYGFDTGLSTNANAGMRTNSGSYPAAEQVCGAGGEMLTLSLRGCMALESLRARDVPRMLKVSSEQR